MIDAGAVGVNLEDAAPDGGAALRDVDDQCARLRAARAAADDAGLPLFLNARTDAAWLGVGPAQERLELIVARARAYAAGRRRRDLRAGPVRAGASSPRSSPRRRCRSTCSPPARRRRSTSWSGSACKRLSVGSGPVRAALDLAARIALEVLETGSSELMVAGTLTYREANALFR